MEKKKTNARMPLIQYGNAMNCIWCGGSFTDFGTGDLRKTREHVLPLKSYKQSNIVSAAHKICNQTRDTDTTWISIGYGASHENVPYSQWMWLQWMIKEYPDVPGIIEVA